MTRHMTHVEFTDVYAKVPLSDDGVGAWQPMTDEQRQGLSCLDCESMVFGQTARRVVGECDEGPVRACLSCYIDRLKDHIDYYRPQS